MTLPNFLISSSIFLVSSSEYSSILCHLQTVMVLLLFQFGFLLYLFLFWLPWLGFPKFCWVIVVRVDIFVLFLVLEEMLSVFHHWEWCLSWVCCNSLYYVEVFPSMPTFWRVFFFNHKWILSKSFSASIEMIIWFLFFNLLIWCFRWIDLWILKNLCILGINST